jgi:hypothetical protein
MAQMQSLIHTANFSLATEAEGVHEAGLAIFSFAPLDLSPKGMNKSFEENK